MPIKPVKKKWTVLTEWPHIRRQLILFLCINIVLGAVGLVQMYFNDRRQDENIKAVNDRLNRIEELLMKSK